MYRKEGVERYDSRRFLKTESIPDSSLVVMTCNAGVLPGASQ
jgi:hypothetical protein